MTLAARREIRRDAVFRLRMPFVTALLKAEVASRSEAFAAWASFASTAPTTFLMTPFTALSTVRFRCRRLRACRARLIVDL